MDPLYWLLLGFAVFVVFTMALKRMLQIKADKARELIDSGALVLDVCSSAEFASRHAEGAVNLPLEQVRRRIADLEPDRARALLVYCHTGSRSTIACRILRGLGYSEVHNLGSFARARSIAKG